MHASQKYSCWLFEFVLLCVFVYLCKFGLRSCVKIKIICRLPLLGYNLFFGIY